MSVNSLSGIADEDAWFHDNITREEAETLLKEYGEERAFLVRDSASSVGDYAISVFSDGEVHHIQVKRHGTDAFFSVEGREPCHGLDELIKTLQCPMSPDDDDAVLLKPLIKSLPPPEVRRHGRTNLLHRATKEGSIRIVAEMVGCKNRSIDAKNEEGQTAAHLASMNGLTDILGLLIKAGTNVDAKDSSSCTPLHYACRNNHPDVIRALLSDGGANPQIRRNDNGWVAMHEAASKGHLKCIQMLYMYNAPLRPRTRDNETPLHLALKANHEEIIKFFDTVVLQEPVFDRKDWFHSSLDRHKALDILRAYRDFCEIDPKASYYLVRRHSKNDGYVLTIILEDKSFNFEIRKEGNYLYIDDGPYLESLEHLVQHYSRWPDGLPCRLQVPVSVIQAKTVLGDPPNLNASRNSLDVPPPLPKRTPISSSPSSSLHRLCGSDVENNNRSVSPSFSKENIPSEALEIGELLGEGEYGEVFIGKLRVSRSSSPIEVAIKTLKTEGEMNEWKKNEFLTEARTMLDLEHPHIVKIIGICWSPKTYMVQELCELGSLQEYLVENADDIVPSEHFKIWAHQIAKGMVYLQRKRFIHRDLAVRNILLKSVLSVKISDFGLSRALGLDSDYYTASQGGRWPIKWYAPESCTHGTFSHATDVWSYGITLWEIYSYGANPYGDLPGKEVIDKVEAGYRLEKPEQCPDQVYQVMLKCWSTNSELRPTFQFLENFFGDADTPNLLCLPLGGMMGGRRRSSDNNSNFGATSLTSNTIPVISPPPLPKTPEPKRNITKSNDETVHSTDICAEVSLMSFD